MPCGSVRHPSCERRGTVEAERPIGETVTQEKRVRVGDSPQHVAVLRPIALNLLHQETTATCGINAKRLKAGWREDELLKACGNDSFHRQP